MNEDILQHNASVTEHDTAVAPPTTSAPPTVRKGKTKSSLLSPKQIPNEPTKNSEGWTDYLLQQAQCLLQTKQADIARQQADIAQRQVEAELLHRIIEMVQSKEVLPDLSAELEQSQQQIVGLQSANAQLQLQWESSARELADFTETVSRLRNENETLRAEITAERTARSNEQKQFKEQIEREIKYEVEGFKGKLAGKLKPIFEQKSTTNDHPPDAELAEFLRGWFHDLEERLSEAGIAILRNNS